MLFNFYDKKVLAGAKMGSRYLDKLYDTNAFRSTTTVLPKGTTLSSKVLPSKIKRTEHQRPFSQLNLTDVEWIIVRPPMEFLITAIHTELVLLWSNDEGANKKSEFEMVDDLTNSEHRCAHYQYNLYKHMWLNANPNPNISFVELENLSHFCDSELGKSVEFKSEQYDFKSYPNWVSKETAVEYIKLTYPYYYSKLMRNIEIENFFYDLILKSNKLYTIN